MHIVDAFFSYNGLFEVIEVTWTKHTHLSTHEALSFRSINAKETTIRKAFNIALESNFLSHRSLAQYTTFLNGKERSARENQLAYFPLVIELESRDINHFPHVVSEAMQLSNYLVDCLAVNPRDLLLSFTPTGSIYIFINPKCFLLQPTKDSILRNTYKNMVLYFKNELDLKYIDMSMYSHGRMIKVHNTCYKGGYFVPGTIDDLYYLFTSGFDGLELLTAKKRPLDWDVPCDISFDLIDLFERSQTLDKVASNKALTYSDSKKRKCVQYLLTNGIHIDSGRRNTSLCAILYDAKSKGIDSSLALELVSSFNDVHLQSSISSMEIKATTTSIYRGSKSFNCEILKDKLSDHLPNNICDGCPFAAFCHASEDRPYFMVYYDHIIKLFNQKASRRHYEAYLMLSKNGYFNGRTANLNDLKDYVRPIRELETKFNILKRIKAHNGIVFILNGKSKGYKVPNEFINMIDHLGRRIGQFLRLLVMSYKPVKSGMLISQSKDTIKRILSLSDSAYYAMLKDFKKLKLITIWKKSLRLSFGLTFIRDYQGKGSYREKFTSQLDYRKVVSGDGSFFGHENTQISFNNADFRGSVINLSLYYRAGPSPSG